VLVSTTRMTILHLISRYRWTGSAEPAVNLCAFQARSGVDARLCCIEGGSLQREASARNVRLMVVADLRRNYTPWGILGAARALARCVERDRVDLLHAHTSHDHWLAALALAFFARRKVPLLRTHHETRRIRVGKVWRRIFNRYTAMNLTPSNAARDYFIGSGAMLPEKVRTMYGGLDLARLTTTLRPPEVRDAWGVPRDALLIAQLSHIGPDRRQAQMLEAFALLAEEFPRAWLMFLGQGNKSTVAELRDRVASFPFAPRVRFSKDSTGKAVPWADQVAAVDRVVVLAVGSEGSSRGVMEAMALARPVIGPRLGVVPELIEEGKTGYLVDPENPLAIAGALKESLRAPQEASQFGGAAAALVRTRFTCQRQAEESLALYREILAPAGAPRPAADSR
jgi:glycosyltransferase involved in cell wall biosynthesis